MLVFDVLRATSKGQIEKKKFKGRSNFFLKFQKPSKIEFFLISFLVTVQFYRQIKMKIFERLNLKFKF